LNYESLRRERRDVKRSSNSIFCDHKHSRGKRL
jgi:hypothetical protein